MIGRGASMDPATDIKQKRDAMISRVDEQLAHVQEQIKSANEQLASMEDQLSRQPREAPRSGPRRSRGKPWLRGTLGLLLAAYILAAAFVSQSPYGDAVARQAPQLVSALTLPLEKLLLFTQPSPAAFQSAAAEPVSPVVIASRDAMSTTVPVSPDPARLLQRMMADLANVEREIEQLKANQQQMASDTAKAVEQLKASQEQEALDAARNANLLKATQEQMAQLIAKASEPKLRPKPSTQQPPVAVGTRKPVPTPATTHVSARPQAPVQSATQR